MVKVTIEQIISLATTGVNTCIVIFYFIFWLKNSKKTAKLALNEIIKCIPNYAAVANTSWTSKIARINYVIAMIRTKCEETNTKFNSKKVTKAVKNYYENEGGTECAKEEQK